MEYMAPVIITNNNIRMNNIKSVGSPRPPIKKGLLSHKTRVKKMIILDSLIEKIKFVRFITIVNSIPQRSLQIKQ